MRLGKYLIERRVGYTSFKYLCEFLHITPLKINAKLTEDKIKLFDANLNALEFENWFKIKVKAEQIEVDNAKSLIIHLYFYFNACTPIDIDEVLGERIINGLLFLMAKGFFPKEKERLNIILSYDSSILEKVNALKLVEPFKKHAPNISVKTDSYDPYENCHWGGLRGEEAYIGYWNTD